MQIPFISGLPGGNGAYPINYYFTASNEIGKPALLGRPGLLSLCTLKVDKEVRGLRVMDNYLYGVAGRYFQQVDRDMAVVNKGTINTTVGKVWMQHNGTQLCIVDGLTGYVYEGGVLTEIADVDFPVPSSFTFQDGYGIITEANTERVWISGFYDFTTWGALDYTIVNTAPDDVLACISDHRELLVFGRRTIDPYVNTGAALFPFTRRGGATQEIGCGAAGSICKRDNVVFFMDNEWQARRFSQYVPEVISPPEVSKEIANYESKADARGIAFTEGGDTFYVLSFPEEGKTWMFSVRTALTAGIENAWSRLTSLAQGETTPGRYRGNCHEFFTGINVVGDYENGKLYGISSSTYFDNGEKIVRQRQAPELFDENSNSRFYVDEFRLRFKSGVGLDVAADMEGYQPKAILEVSADQARTWSSEMWADIGKIGESETISAWNKLGGFRSFIPRVTVVSPVDSAIYDASVRVRLGKS